MYMCPSCCVATPCGTVSYSFTGCSAPLDGVLVSLTKAGVAVSSGQVVFRVGSITLNATGAGYFTAPTLTISAPAAGGTQATATCTVLANGNVGTITVTNAGSSYTGSPTVTFSAPPSSVTATATATIDGTGAVNGFTVGNPSANGFYRTVPAVTVSGGGGTGATATATVTGGRVVSIAVNNPGTGYTSTPSVSIVAPPVATTATGTVNRLTSAVLPFYATGSHVVAWSLGGWYGGTSTVSLTCGTSPNNVALTLFPDKSMPVTITLRGCDPATGNGSGTIRIVDAQTGVVLANGAVNSSGQLSTTVRTPQATNVSVKATATDGSGRLTYTATEVTFTTSTCSSSLTAGFNPSAVITACIPLSGCAYPPATTLSLVDSRYGTKTLTWSSVNQEWAFTDGSGNKWSITYDWRIVINNNPSFTSTTVTGTFSCPPALASEWTVTVANIRYSVGDKFNVTE